jgi:type IV secretion system protein VirD4
MNLFEVLFKMIGDIAVSLFKVLFEALGLASKSFLIKDGTYRATFGRTGDLLFGFNKGLCLSGTGSLTRKASFRHSIVFSPSGGGKSTVVVIPSILRMTRWPCSLIVHDPSGELYSLTSGYLKSIGYDVRVLSFTKPGSSSHYNPMARAERSADLRKVSSMIVRQAMGGNKADPFWDQSAASLVTVLMQVLRTQPPQFRNLANVRHLLNSFGNNPEKLDALVARFASEELFQEYAAIQAYQDKMRSGIIASARAALDMWADEDIAKLTSTDDIPLESIRERPTAIFVQSRTAELEYYSLLVSLFFEQLIGVLMQDLPKPNDLDVFLIVDEASSLRVPVLPTAISNLRKYRCGLMLAYQDYSQLVHIYGRYEAETIRQNAYVKMFFSDQSLETSVDLERLMGKYEAEDDKGRQRVRPLLTSDEIRILPKNRALIIAGGHRPILAKLRPYYAQRRLRSQTLLQPVTLDTEGLSAVTLLSLDVEPHPPMAVTPYVEEQPE